MDEKKTNKSEEDRLLDPIAKSILRDLQAEADEAAAQQEQEEHRSQEHIMPPPPITVIVKNGIITIVLDSGEVITCDDENLSENELIHCKMALEQDGNDADGSQGGQDWFAPTTAAPTTAAPTTAAPTTAAPTTAAPTTAFPSATPTTAVPTATPTTANPTRTGEGEPSYHPTLYTKDPLILRGTIYYDHNASGGRDSNIDSVEFGNDVEYNYGLGGVTIKLMECDSQTNKGLVSGQDMVYEEGKNTYATTVSQGYDVLMHPRMVRREENGGVYNLINIKESRAYYIYATAPQGYILTGGVCNDKEKGWECQYSSAQKFAQGYSGNKEVNNRKLLRGSGGNHNKNKIRNLNGDEALPQELELGIREGRSKKCVSVDRSGIPDSRLDLGVMRIGDVNFGDTEVELAMDLIEPEINTRPGRERERGLRSLIADIRERVLQTDPVKNDDGTYSYVLLQADKDAIGTVTAEVLASNLDITLPKNGAVLDSVSPIAVVYFAPPPEVDEDASNSTSTDDPNNSTATNAAAAPTRETDAARDAPTTSSRRRNAVGGKLSVTVLVRGHSNRDHNVDFDYIVQDSINRDSYNIRRQLTSYNQNCRDQTTKVVDLGFKVNDFSEIHANTGVEKTSSRLKDRQQQALDGTEDEQAFSSACGEKKVLPEYFETSLGGLKLKTKARTYIVDEGGGTPWEIVVIIVAVCVFVLCMGYYLCRRGLKKKQKKSKEMEGSQFNSSRRLDVSYTSSVDDKIGASYNSSVLDLSPEKIRQYDGDTVESSERSSKETRKSIRQYDGDTVESSERSSKEMRKSITVRRMDDTRKSMTGGGMDDTSPPTTVSAAINQAPTSQQRRYLTGMMQREINNVTAAITNERRRFGGGGGGGNTRRSGSIRRSTTGEMTRHDSMESSISDLEARLQHNLSERSGSTRKSTTGETRRRDSMQSSTSDPEARLQNNLPIETAIATAKDPKSLGMVKQQQYDNIKSFTSRNAIPKIINMSSSEDDESSDSSSDSSSSSSDEESVPSSQSRSRKRQMNRALREKKTQSRKTTKKNTSEKKNRSKSKKNTSYDRREGLKRRSSQDNVDIARGRRRNSEVYRRTSGKSNVTWDMGSEQSSRRSSSLV